MIELTEDQLITIELEPIIKAGRAKVRANAGPTKRGKRRTARALGQNMSSFWQLPTEERILIHQISKRGRK